jgi:acyl-CoA synthetase (AMP-forming)/AMP-acid ligase II
VSMEGFKAIIVWDAASTKSKKGPTAKDAIVLAAGKAKCPVYTYDVLLQAGRLHVSSCSAWYQRVETNMRNVQPDQGAILIYTSGTTGKPKAVQVHPPPPQCHSRMSLRSTLQRPIACVLSHVSYRHSPRSTLHSPLDHHASSDQPRLRHLDCTFAL